MTLSQLLHLLVQELRGGRARAVPLIGSLAVGVAAVVLVAGLGDSVSRAIRLEARPLLGADVAVRSFLPLPAELDSVVEAERVDTIDLLTMVATPPGADGRPGRSVMAELKAVGAGWPWYGTPTLDPPISLETLLDPEGVVVEPALLERLALATAASPGGPASAGGAPGPGLTLRIGGASFTVRGTVTREPGRLPSGLVTGPRVLISHEGLARAGLGNSGARITRRALFRAPDEAEANALATRLRGLVGTRASVETWSDAQPGAQRSISQTTSWLGLVALLALLVGGVGVAQATRAWMARRLDAIAVQRTLGLTSAEIGAVALAQTALLALAGSLLGAGLGTVALSLTPWLLDGLLPREAVQPWQPAAIARGLALGVGMAVLFAWRPLWQAARVPPLRVLRRDVEPLPESPAQAALSLLVIGGGVGVLAWVQSGDLQVTGAFVGSLGVVAALGAGGATTVARGLSLLSHRVGRWWLRHGLASLGRPGSGLVAAVVSLGLGVLVVLTTVLVEGRLYAQISQEFPESAPSAFLLDVQPDQRTGVEAVLADAGATHTRGAPMVVGRLLAIDDVSVETLAAARGEGERWQYTREQRLSYGIELPADTTFVQGGPFSEDAAGELSIEERYADGLGVKLGSKVRFDVQGVPITLTVTSIRRVSWESFNMNFFLLVDSGVLEGAPQSHLLTTQLSAAREPEVQDQLASQYPNVTLVSVRTALTQARGLLEKLAWGIRAVGAFTAVAGMAILAAGVAADASRRGRQVALLKTLGTTRAGVIGVLAVEYATVGLLAGLLGSVGALGLAWVIVNQLMRLTWRTDPVTIGVAVLVSAVSCAAVGVLANTRALRVRPAEVLRGE